MKQLKEQSKTSLIRTRDDCRLCKSRSLERVWSFGPTPLANSYLNPEEVGQPEPLIPLDAYYCDNCSLVQLRDVVAPEAMFSNYLYVSSTSPSFVEHFRDYADSLIENFSLDDDDLVVDVGSNDGVLLKPLQDEGINVLGIDPAENIAAEATSSGIETWPEFLNADVAQRVVRDKGQATVVTANNVFAHTDDIDGFVAGIKSMLKPDGVFVFEVQYLAKLLENNLFDIVYHEHVNYYHLGPLKSYFQDQGMNLFDVEQVPVHGGSIRVFVSKDNRETTAKLAKLLEQEEAAGLNSIKPYQDFAKRIQDNKNKLRTIIDSIKADNKTIAGFGAPAKATTLMYAFGLTGDDIDFIVDDAPLKQGRVMPGTHVPIFASDKLYEAKPDYCLILAWNFAEPIMANHERFTEAGGKWIIPVPEPRLI